MRTHSRRLSRLSLALLLNGPALLPVQPLLAQTTDAGTLQLRTGDREIGTETFTATITGSAITFSTRVAYAGRRPAPEFTANLDRSSGEDFAFQLESRGGTGGGQTFAVQKRHRLTVRRVARGADQATEMPGGADVIVLADSIFVPYLQAVALATETGRPLTAVMLPGARRVSFTARRTTTASGTLIRLSGGLEAEIELGGHGEVLRISLPGSGQEAVRTRN